MKQLINMCICGGSKVRPATMKGIDVLQCISCGVIRQSVHMTEAELDEWYEKQYHDGIFSHDYDHDIKIANLRLKEYGLKKNTTILDIGCGNGAFVDASRKKGIQAYGCEVGDGASQSKFTYQGKVEDIHFPTDHFDTVVIHDVLEHLVNPLQFCIEVRRILKQGGTFIIDFPDFFVPEGDHHWKEIEHLWMLNEEQVVNILVGLGFNLKEIKKPIPSKLVFYAEAPTEQRQSIIIPPGIGDTWWSLLKLKSFCESNQIGIPDVYIMSDNGKKDRSIDFVKRAPFLNAKGYMKYPNKAQDEVWREAYMLDGRTVFTRKDLPVDADYFLAYNGVLRAGKNIDEVDTLYQSDWLYDQFISLEERWYGENCVKEWGEYLIAYFVDHGMYGKHWIKEFSKAHIKKTLELLHKQTGKKIVLVGSEWDDNAFTKDLAKGFDFVINMIGKTELEEFIGMIRYSSGMIGFPSGATFMGVKFKKPVMCIWNKYFTTKFWWNACPKESWNNWYGIIDSRHAKPDTVVNGFMKLIDENIEDTKEIPVKNSKKPQKTAKKAEKTASKTGEKKTKRDQKEPFFVSKGAKLVACVLKSGGDFDRTYVSRLEKNIKKHTNYPIKLVCLSDLENTGADETIKLKHNWQSWWSKIELFRPDVFNEEPVVYFDLDTLVLTNIDGLIGSKHSFTMLEAFNKKRNPFASGVMAWSGNYSEIYTEFKKNFRQVIENRTTNDQKFIHKVLTEEYGIIPERVQKFVNVASFKRECNHPTGAPKGTNIVCFHGKPRPIEVTLPWVQEAWA